MKVEGERDELKGLVNIMKREITALHVRRDNLLREGGREQGRDSRIDISRGSRSGPRESSRQSLGGRWRPTRRGGE